MGRLRPLPLIPRNTRMGRTPSTAHPVFFTLRPDRSRNGPAAPPEAQPTGPTPQRSLCFARTPTDRADPATKPLLRPNLNRPGRLPQRTDPATNPNFPDQLPQRTRRSARVTAEWDGFRRNPLFPEELPATTDSGPPLRKASAGAKYKCVFSRKPRLRRVVFRRFLLLLQLF